MTMEKQELLLLGEISGKIDGIGKHLAQQDVRMDRQETAIKDLADRQDANHKNLEARVRTLEQRAAVAGAISGGAVSIGVALIIEKAKSWLTTGGSGH